MAVSALMLLVERQEGYLLQPVKNMGDGGGGHWLIRMEWRPTRWSVCLPVLIFPCTIKSRSSLLAPAHPGGPGEMAVKRLWCINLLTYSLTYLLLSLQCSIICMLHYVLTLTESRT